MNCATNSCNQGRRVCPTPSVCGSVFHQHEGLAVVNRGQGLHMPTEPEDADEWHGTWRDALVWTIGAICGAVVVAVLVVLSLSRGSL